MSAISTLPGIGKKRAAKVVAGRPYQSINELSEVLDDPKVAESLSKILSFE